MIGLLILTYLTFISLGLGSSLLGSAWPVMYGQFGVDAAAAGTVSMLISGSTIVATYLCARLLRRFGTGFVLAAGLCLMAAAIFAFSLSGHFLLLCLLAIPLGFGAGSVDTSGNGFLAVHYNAKHISWLHCFWGVGATAGPAVMVLSLTQLGGWRMGYRIVAVVQLAVVGILFASLARWKRVRSAEEAQLEPSADSSPEEVPSTSALLRLRGAPMAILLFFVTGGMETTLALWGSTYLVLARGVSQETATSWLALYFFGLTAGRFLFGFLAARLHNKGMIRIGQSIIAVGLLVLVLPFDQALAPSFILLGLGVAPIFPNYVHSTPKLFGKQHAQAMIGIQMVGTHSGNMFLPPLFGLIGRQFGYQLFPIFVGVLFLFTVWSVTALFRYLPKGDTVQTATKG